MLTWELCVLKTPASQRGPGGTAPTTSLHVPWHGMSIVSQPTPSTRHLALGYSAVPSPMCPRHCVHKHPPPRSIPGERALVLLCLQMVTGRGGWNACKSSAAPKRAPALRRAMGGSKTQPSAVLSPASCCCIYL